MQLQLLHPKQKPEDLCTNTRRQEFTESAHYACLYHAIAWLYNAILRCPDHPITSYLELLPLVLDLFHERLEPLLSADVFQKRIMFGEKRVVNESA